jgi:hypothetical protein
MILAVISAGLYTSHSLRSLCITLTALWRYGSNGFILSEKIQRNYGGIQRHFGTIGYGGVPQAGSKTEEMQQQHLELQVGTEVLRI